MAGYVFTHDEAKRVASTVKAKEGRPHTRLPPRKRPFRGQGGGGDCACSEVDEFYMFGVPTGGTVDVDYTINAATETLTFNYNTNSADLKTELITHSEITTNECTVFGGPWPNQAIYVLWEGDLANTSIAFPSIDDSGLTGTNVSLHMRKVSAYDWSGY